MTGGLNDIEAGKLEKQNEGEDGDGDELEVKKKKRKGPKEPNPLSVKRRKQIMQLLPVLIKSRKETK